MHVDQPGRDPAAARVDHARAGRRAQIRADGLDLPFAISTSALSSRVPVPVSTVAPRINVAVAAPALYVDG